MNVRLFPLKSSLSRETYHRWTVSSPEHSADGTKFILFFLPPLTRFRVLALQCRVGYVLWFLELIPTVPDSRADSC